MDRPRIEKGSIRALGQKVERLGKTATRGARTGLAVAGGGAMAASPAAAAAQPAHKHEASRPPHAVNLLLPQQAQSVENRLGAGVVRLSGSSNPNVRVVPYSNSNNTSTIEVDITIPNGQSASGGVGAPEPEKGYSLYVTAPYGKDAEPDTRHTESVFLTEGTLVDGKVHDPDSSMVFEDTQNGVVFYDKYGTGVSSDKAAHIEASASSSATSPDLYHMTMPQFKTISSQALDFITNAGRGVYTNLPPSEAPSGGVADPLRGGTGIPS